MTKELSVKGMTVGTDEFVKTAKMGERQAETQEALENYEEAVEELSEHLHRFTDEQWHRLYDINSDLIPE